MFTETLKEENSPAYIKKITTKYYNKVFPFYTSAGEDFILKSNIPVANEMATKRESSQNFISNDYTKISCRLFINPKAKAKILIVNGYNESYLKYAEVIYDLYHKGYSVYVYDHRGQGFSEKFPDQKNRGFMNSFDDLVNDLQLFFNFVDNHNQKMKVFVLAHSMGGAVTALSVCQNKIQPSRVVFSAPMFGIILTALPFLEYPIYLLSRVLSELGFAHMYAFGQTDCFPLKSFEKNEVTHSRARYQIWQTHIRETPEVQLGGPTFQWIRESVHASRLVRISGKDNKIPMLLLQAEKDTVVLNAAQDIFIKHCANSTKKIIQNSKHEILMEIDSIRNQAMKYIEDFFAEAITV